MSKKQSRMTDARQRTGRDRIGHSGDNRELSSYLLVLFFLVVTIIAGNLTLTLLASSHAVLVSTDISSGMEKTYLTSGSSTYESFSDEYVYKVVYQVCVAFRTHLGLREDETALFPIAFSIARARLVFRRQSDPSYRRVVSARVSEEECTCLLREITCEMAAAGIEAVPSGLQGLSPHGVATWSLRGLKVGEYKCAVLARIKAGAESRLPQAIGPENHRIMRRIEFEMPTDNDLRFNICVQSPTMTTLRQIGAIIMSIVGFLAAAAAVLEFTGKRLTRWWTDRGFRNRSGAQP